MKIATIDDIKEAQEKIAAVVRKTECRYSKSCSERAGLEVFLKFENLQKTGSFKIRGATNRIANLTDEERKRGVICSSAGNHAQGVAYAASRLNIPATVVMPLSAPLVKVLATKGYGASIIQHGAIFDEAFEYAKKIAVEKNMVFIPPFADPLIIAGQGTIGLELLEQMQEVDSIVIPVGGGGLISGIATAIKTINPKIKIIGVQAANTASMQKSFLNKQIVSNIENSGTMADGIAVKHPNEYILNNYILKYVDEMVTVTEEEMADAMVFLLERCKTVVEASGAASMAAVFQKKLDLGKKTCCVLSGGNVDLNIVSKVIDQGLSRRGRIVQLEVRIADQPGSLSKLTKIIADKRANILEVYHDRLATGMLLNETKIEFVLETFSHEHIEEIKQELRAVGAKV